MSDSAASFELPQSDEAERSVLGAVLVDNLHLDELADVLKPDDFYRQSHQRIFAVMCEMAGVGSPIDVLTLSDKLKSGGELESCGGPLYLSRLMDGIPRLLNVKHYARIVRDRSVRRMLVKTANEIATEASAGEVDVEQLLGDSERKIFAIAEDRMNTGFITMKELLAESLDLIDERQKSDSNITGVPSGFTDFDDITSGMQRGDLLILAARPSMGKTAWALSAAQNAAIRYGQKVAVFSLEMAAIQLSMRLLFSEARVDMQKMRRGHLSDHHWSKLIHAFERLSTAPIFMDDTTGCSVTEMRAKCRRLQAEQGLDLVVVDYLQLMGGGGKSENRQQEISAISRSLKEMARELNVPVLALSQLSRAPDQRKDDHRPMLSDLRESGSIEQDADVVAFIFREEVYLVREGKEVGDKEGIAEIIIAKQRNGPVDTVKMAFIKEWTRFENLDRGQRPQGAPPTAAGQSAKPGSLKAAPEPEDDRAPF